MTAEIINQFTTLTAATIIYLIKAWLDISKLQKELKQERERMSYWHGKYSEMKEKYCLSDEENNLDK